jgi:hypothetical protein
MNARAPLFDSQQAQDQIQKQWDRDIVSQLQDYIRIPDFKSAGNVLRPYMAVKLSLRLPQLVEADKAVAELKALVEDNAPLRARMTFEGAVGAAGWNAPSSANWFEAALT